MTVFRPEVQALRAVAVASVVLYHLWPERLPGGFVGVDIFFVISGFLITQHLMGEISRTGRVALGAFWARRIRRLLPAAFTVIAVSLVLLFAIMPRVTWQENLQQLGASAAYVENWLLGFDAVDYLAAENSATLAQHYWSLSVEEQFYVVWPIVLLAALAVARLLRRGTPRTAVRWALVAVFVGSLIVSVVMTAEVNDSYAELRLAPHGISFLTDGIIVQRYVEIDGVLRKILMVTKMRGFDHSHELRLYDIDASGIVMRDCPAGYEGLLTGVARRSVERQR